MFESKNFYQIEALFTGTRDRVEVTPEITNFFEGKVILVTGAGGSIGGAIVEKLIYCNPKEIICIENSEYNLFKLESFLEKKNQNDVKITTKYFDIRDFYSMKWLFENSNIDVVFHSAALKHVKIVESNGEEATKTNVIATYNLMNLADKHKTKRFLLISTDKVVEAKSFMGKTKKIGEYLANYFSKKSSTTFLTVRFGNVIGSSGSVIPIFLDRIQNNEPLIVRDFKVKRYFMSINEAIFLVLKATVEGKSGESYILKMGEQIYIKDVAKKLLKFTNVKNIELIETRLLKGENLEESLMTNREKNISTELNDFFVFHNDDIPGNILEIIDMIEKKSYSIEDLTKIIESIV